MSYTHVLEITAPWAAILTALVAAGAYVLYRWDIYSKRTELENYLKAEKAAARDKGQRTILHLMARLGLTESEVLQASFGSKHIVRRIAADPTTSVPNARGRSIASGETEVVSPAKHKRDNWRDGACAVLWRGL